MDNPLSLSGVFGEEFVVVWVLSPLLCPLPEALGEILLAGGLFLLSALLGEGLLDDVPLLLAACIRDISSVEVSLCLSPLCRELLVEG